MTATTPVKRLYVLDTNVLIHDPFAMFHFQEHDILIPMIVLEELDNHKKGITEIARNARQASRYLDELVEHVALRDIKKGIPLTQSKYSEGINGACIGHLFFQTTEAPEAFPQILSLMINDNKILATVQVFSKERSDTEVILVSKDINVRIKAAALGLHAEDYSSDEAVEDVNLLYNGMLELPQDFWDMDSSTEKIKSWDKGSGTFYQITDKIVEGWYPNQFLYIPDMTDKSISSFEAIVRKVNGHAAIIEVLRNYCTQKNNVWGIQARNREQNFALNALLDPEIDFVTLLGTAGTGKTLMALVAGLVQAIDKKIFTEIIVTRDTISIGEDIGFLPGTEEEKMFPWMGALMDNLEMLCRQSTGKTGAAVTDWEHSTTNNMIMKRVKIRALNFMRGRTFLTRYVIIDEAQNLTAKQMKALITRAGPGTKIICLGNLGQIDTPYLSATTSGLTYAVERFKNCPFAAHLILPKGERSRLADFANENL